jgi:hypothetical protein
MIKCDVKAGTQEGGERSGLKHRNLMDAKKVGNVFF